MWVRWSVAPSIVENLRSVSRWDMVRHGETVRLSDYYSPHSDGIPMETVSKMCPLLFYLEDGSHQITWVWQGFFWDVKKQVLPICQLSTKAVLQEVKDAEGRVVLFIDEAGRIWHFADGRGNFLLAKSQTTTWDASNLVLVNSGIDYQPQLVDCWNLQLLHQDGGRKNLWIIYLRISCCRQYNFKYCLSQQLQNYPRFNLKEKFNLSIYLDEVLCLCLHDPKWCMWESIGF